MRSGGHRCSTSCSGDFRVSTGECSVVYVTSGGQPRISNVESACMMAYPIGVMATPSKRKAGPNAGFDANSVRRALDAQVRDITGRVPPEVMAKVLKIRQTILRILARWDNFGPGSAELFVVTRTATDYLPTSLAAYLKLPKAYPARRTTRAGKTAKEILVDQLTLLERKMNEIAEDVVRHDLDRLLAHGRFLQERFGRSPLSLEPPTSSEE